MVAETRGNLPDAKSPAPGQGILEMEKGRLANCLIDASKMVTETSQKLGDGQNATVSRFASRAASTLEQAGQYFNSADPKDMLEDAKAFAKRHPEIVIGGALIAGLMLGRFLRSKPAQKEIEPSQFQQEDSFPPALKEPEEGTGGY